MNRIDRVKAKIEQIERLLAEVKNELQTLGEEHQSQSKKIHKEEPTPPKEELQDEYEKLYEKFKVNDFEAIYDFIKRKSPTYLKAFCNANSLPLDVTKARDNIADEVMRWLAKRKAFRGYDHDLF